MNYTFRLIAVPKYTKYIRFVNKSVTRRGQNKFRYDPIIYLVKKKCQFTANTYDSFRLIF